MTTQLARYLKDFSTPETASITLPETDLDFAGTEMDAPFPVFNEAEPVDLEAERRAAYAEGYEAAVAELTERHSLALAEQERAHAETIAQLVTRRDELLAGAVVEGLSKISAGIAFAVSDQVAQALAPLFSEQIVENAVAELAKLLEGEMAGGDVATVVVTGPRQMFDRLLDALPERAEALRHVEADDLDLSVEVGDRVLVTRVSAWSASLRKVMG